MVTQENQFYFATFYQTADSSICDYQHIPWRPCNHGAGVMPLALRTREVAAVPLETPTPKPRYLLIFIPMPNYVHPGKQQIYSNFRPTAHTSNRHLYPHQQTIIRVQARWDQPANRKISCALCWDVDQSTEPLYEQNTIHWLVTQLPVHGTMEPGDH